MTRIATKLMSASIRCVCVISEVEPLGVFARTVLTTSASTGVTINGDNVWYSLVSSSPRKFNLDSRVDSLTTGGISTTGITSGIVVDPQGGIHEIKNQDYSYAADGDNWTLGLGPSNGGASTGISNLSADKSSVYGLNLTGSGGRIRESLTGADFWSDRVNTAPGESIRFHSSQCGGSIASRDTSIRMGPSMGTVSHKISIASDPRSVFTLCEFGCVIDDDGVISYTTDSGTTWDEHDIGEVGVLAGCVFSGHVIIAGASGAVYYTDDFFETVTVIDTLPEVFDPTTEYYIALYSRNAVIRTAGSTYLLENIQ